MTNSALVKIGQKNPRADFYIPSMKIIVEAKFMRPADRVQKIIDEIAADLSLYRSLGNDCAGVIAFIWDDGARTNEHDYLRQGLKKMPGLVDAVIVSRPRDWTEGVSRCHAGESLLERRRRDDPLRSVTGRFGNRGLACISKGYAIPPYANVGGEA